MLRYGSPMAVAAPVTTLVARRYSWSIVDSVVYKLWQWQTRGEQGSRILTSGVCVARA
jgi:hypothetical protein